MRLTQLVAGCKRPAHLFTYTLLFAAGTAVIAESTEASAPVDPPARSADILAPLAPETPRQDAPWLPPNEAIWSVPVLHTTGLFLVMRTTEAVLWPTPFADTRPRFWLRNYEHAFTEPPLFDRDERAFEWDHDHYTINVFGHGLLGSELFYRPRRCGATLLEAFAFAAGASAVWEYGFEANGVRPSALDLAFTPIAGLVLGEARYAGWSAAGSISNRTLRGAVRALLDPLGELSRAAGTPC